jgi:hypothetical protein
MLSVTSQQATCASAVSFEESDGSNLFASWLLDDKEVPHSFERDERRPPKEKKPFEINRYLDWTNKLPITTSDLRALISARAGDLTAEECPFSVMFIDNDIQEGEEFLMYAYPTSGPFFQRIVDLKSAVTCFEGAHSSISGQKMRSAVIHDCNPLGSRADGLGQSKHRRVLATTVPLDGWMSGCAFALISWKEDLTDLSLRALAQTVLSLLYALGPIDRALFDRCEADPAPADPHAPQASRPAEGWVPYARSMAVLDPFFRALAKSLFAAGPAALLEASFARSVAWQPLPLQLSLDISEALGRLEAAAAAALFAPALSSSVGEADKLQQGAGTALCCALGSSLYVDGYVISSHLSAQDVWLTTQFAKLQGWLVSQADTEPLQVCVSVWRVRVGAGGAVGRQGRQGGEGIGVRGLCAGL